MAEATMRRLALAGLLASVAATVQAETKTWDAGIDNVWDAATANWTGQTFADTDDVVFGNTGVGTVVIAAGNRVPNTVTFAHSSGTYQFDAGGGNFAATGSLAVSGGGTVQFGNLTNAPLLPTWTTTFLSGGSTLNVTRPGGYVGSTGAQVTISGGTLRTATDNSVTYTTDNPISVGGGGATLAGRITSNVSLLAFSGSLTGAGALTLLTEGGAANWRGSPGLRISGGDNSGFTGPAFVASTATQAGQFGSGVAVFPSAGSLLSGASSVTPRDGGILGIGFAAGSGALSNVVPGRRGGLGVTGSGTLQAESDPLGFVGPGGMFLIDNRSSLNNDRLADTAALAFDSVRLHMIGRDADNNKVLEVAGAATLSGGNRLSFDRVKSNNSGVKLQLASLSEPSGGASLLIDNGNSSDYYGTTDSLCHVIVTGSKPAVVNGMISPAVQFYPGANVLGSFMTFDGNDLVKASMTTYAGDFAGAGATEIVNYTGAGTTLSGTGTLSIHALRHAGSGDLNLGERTIALGSGGFMTTSRNTTSGTLDFGSVRGYIAAYNGAAQATISAGLTGSGGLTCMGTSQSLNLTGNTANTFTGGLVIHGGTVALSSNGANLNDVEVGPFGRLCPNSSSSATTGCIIGGLSGTGRVAGWWQGSSTPRPVTIKPASGTHVFEGRLANGDGGSLLSVIKDGAGTQVFGSDSTGTYTGTTQVLDGFLRIDGNFSAASGAVTVDGGAFGGIGAVGGSVTVAAAGVLAATSLASSTGLSVAGDLTVAGKVGLRVDSVVKGVYALATVDGTVDVSGATVETLPDDLTGALSVEGNKVLLTVSGSGGTVILVR